MFARLPIEFVFKMLEETICCSHVSACFCSVNDIDDFCWCMILNEFV